MRSDIITGSKRLMRKYHEQLSVKKFNNLGKTDKLLERHKLPNSLKEK